jgi:hypothetical protein
MRKITSALDDAQLDAALDRLSAPVPSDALTQRARSMTPKPDRAVFTPRRTAAAVLAVASCDRDSPERKHATDWAKCSDAGAGPDCGD